MRIPDLWRWDGTIGRGAYLAWGAILFAVKFNVDRLVSWLWFGRSWSIFDYQRAGEALWRTLPSAEDSRYFAALLAVALPFLWAGVVLTLKRLRSAGLPLWLVLLFFAPVLKLIFFAVLCVVPSREEMRERALAPGDIKGAFGFLIPRSAAGSAIAGLIAGVGIGGSATWLGTLVLREYGWSLFVGLPFVMGFVAVLVYGYHEPRGRGPCMLLALSATGVAGLVLLALAFEGIICLIMAAPLAVGIAVAGGAVGYFVQSQRWWHGKSPDLLCVVVLAVPAVMGLEHAQQAQAPLLAVTTSVEVAAPPEAVWRHVVSFSELPAPREWLFRLGIAYPVRAEIDGRGPGAVRLCHFSTGPFVEPIEVWDEPRLLKFSVTSNPAPMQEWTPYRDVHPPHLEGFLESKGGQFLLVRLPGGRTRLEGTTWYHHRMWPVKYWQWWSDYIIHRIHLRVLNHVKALAESAPVETERAGL